MVIRTPAACAAIETSASMANLRSLTTADVATSGPQMSLRIIVIGSDRLDALMTMACDLAPLRISSLSPG